MEVSYKVSSSVSRFTDDRVYIPPAMQVCTQPETLKLQMCQKTYCHRRAAAKK